MVKTLFNYSIVKIHHFTHLAPPTYCCFFLPGRDRALLKCIPYFEIFFLSLFLICWWYFIPMFKHYCNEKISRGGIRGVQSFKDHRKGVFYYLMDCISRRCGPFVFSFFKIIVLDFLAQASYWLYNFKNCCFSDEREVLLCRWIGEYTVSSCKVHVCFTLLDYCRLLNCWLMTQRSCLGKYSRVCGGCLEQAKLPVCFLLPVLQGNTWCIWSLHFIKGLFFVFWVFPLKQVLYFSQYNKAL